MTPCMSPLPHEGPLQEKPSLALIQEEAEAQGVKSILGKGIKTAKDAKWRGADELVQFVWGTTALIMELVWIMEFL